jgi:hypothetical protein
VLLGEWFTVDEGVVQAIDMFDEDGIGLASLSSTKVPKKFFTHYLNAEE